MFSTDTEGTQKLQSDILLENLSTNSYFVKSNFTSKNKALKTTAQNVILAINELLKKQADLTDTITTAVAQCYGVVGNTMSQPELAETLHAVGENTILAIGALHKKIIALEEAADDRIYDHEDQFMVIDKQTAFKLTHIPCGPVRMYVDGIRYFSNCFEYDKTTNTAKWILTEDNGFDIQNMMVVIVYDYLQEAGGMEL